MHNTVESYPETASADNDNESIIMSLFILLNSVERIKESSLRLESSLISKENTVRAVGANADPAPPPPVIELLVHKILQLSFAVESTLSNLNRQVGG